LKFLTHGEYDADSTILLSGDLQSKWDNLFGIRGFDLYDVNAAIAFNSLFCGIDLCISGFGVGFNLSVGKELIYFNGFVEVPNLSKVFLEAGLSGQNQYNLAISFRDIGSQWNKMVGPQSPIHIDVNAIPADWGIKNMALYIAPEDGTFNNKYYSAGFYMMGGFRLIGIDCDVNVEVTDHDFDFGVHISLSTFEQDLKKELGFAILANPDQFPSWTPAMIEQLMGEISGELKDGIKIIEIKNVSISDWSVAHLATADLNPEFSMEYVFLGHHHFKTQVKLLSWYKAFHNFFDLFLKILFQ